MRYYVAIVHKDADSDFGVSFPDFPGCVTAGSTLAEAAAMAAEALNAHIDLMVDEGLTVPVPSGLDAVLTDRTNRDGTPVMIAMTSKKTARIVRVDITLPEDVLARIDAHAQRVGMNRSGFIVHAAKREIENA